MGRGIGSLDFGLVDGLWLMADGFLSGSEVIILRIKSGNGKWGEEWEVLNWGWLIANG